MNTDLQNFITQNLIPLRLESDRNIKTLSPHRHGTMSHLSCLLPADKGQRVLWEEKGHMGH